MGGVIGGVGNVFGPEVGVPSTLVGIAAGRFYGPAVFGALGGFLGDFAHYELCDKIPSNKMPTNIPPKVSPKTQPSPPPKTPPAAKGPGGGGGGGENGPNRNTGFVNLAPVTCTYTWYDYYSDGKYIGSGAVSVQCD